MSTKFDIYNVETASTSSASSVIDWLHNLPDPKDYSQDKGLSPQRTKRRKYCEKLGKRQKLAEIPTNSMAPPRRASPRKAVEKLNSDIPLTSTSPPRRRGRPKKLAPPLSTPTSQRIRLSSHSDEEPTPKPKYAGTIPQLDTSSSAHVFAQPSSPRRSTASSPSRSNTTTSSRGGTRSGSPVKRIGDFFLSDTAMEIQNIGRYDIPLSVKEMCRDMRLIEARRHVIPEAVRSRAITDSMDFLLEDNTFVNEKEQMESPPIGHEQFYERVVEILDAALECEKKGYNEAAWNCEVHSTLLRLALRGHWQSKGIWYRNITSARIHDPLLLPTVSGSVTQSKMVDFALLMDPTRDLNRELFEGITTTLRGEGRTTINHTAMYEVKYSPIAVSIETKRANVDEDGADVQLGLWVSAHFARLRQLTGDAFPLPALPLVTVQGHAWKMMIAEAKADRSIILLKEIMLGKTDSVLGIYQIVAALRRLARWVDEDYKPWFEQKALGLPVKYMRTAGKFHS